MYRNNLQNTLFLRWMKELPENLVGARPTLNLGYAWACLDTGDLEAVEPRLQDAEQSLEQSFEPALDEESKEKAYFLKAALFLARAYLAAAYGNWASTVENARYALALIPETDPF
jgi:LuxR family transcriptional regulator, maltose regulon positive regulatory protein